MPNEETVETTEVVDETKDVPAEKPDKTFTQAELETILAGRLKKYGDYDELKAEVERLREETATEQEKAIEAARREAVAEATRDAEARLKRAEARGIAAELGFNDPADAYLFLDLEQVPVIDGDVDTEALKKALADVGEKRPYLLKETRPSAGDVGIGRKGTQPDPGPGVSRLEAAFDSAFASK